MFLASSEQSLAEASNAIDSFSAKQKIVFMANIFEHGLMTVPFPINLIIGFVKKYRKRAGLENMCNLLISRDEKTVAIFLDETKTHMRYGYDTEDNDSVGGFSQREINLLFDSITD